MFMHQALVPSTYTMEVFEFQDGDPTYQHTNPDGTIFPGGISVAKLQQGLSENEGKFTGPSGEVYALSVAAWEGQDPEKTLLQMVFHTTPLFPADIDPELRQAPFSQPSTQTSSPAASTDKDNASPSSLRARSSPAAGSKRTSDFISCSDVHGEHRVKIQLSKTPDSGVTANILLALPEITTTNIHCPVCNETIRFSETLDKRIQYGIEWWGSEAKIQLIFEHPIGVEETQTVPEGSPFVVHRYRRYTPISAPSRQKDPDIELSIVLKTHDHLVTLLSERGETTAQMLLALPEATETELLCPLCDEKLPVKEPLSEYIRILADDASGDATPIELSISHPREIPVTRTPLSASLIHARQHSNTDAFAQKQYEGYPGFVVRKRGNKA